MPSLTLLVAGFLAVSIAAATEKKVVCYYNSWLTQNEGKDKFNIGDIEASLCTHFIYEALDFDGNNVVSPVPCIDLPIGGGKDGYKLFTILRRKNPSAKFLVSLRAATVEQSSLFSTMISTQESRRHFIENVADFLKTQEFDGLDIHWQWPTVKERGSGPADRDNLILLLKELRERFDQERLLLTIVASGLIWLDSQAYNISEVSKYVDFVNLMTLHGTYHTETGHSAALHGMWSIDSSVKYWLDQGLSKEKLLMGVPTYGRGWTLLDPKNNTVGAPAKGDSTAGAHPKASSYFAYNEMCEMIREGGWSLRFDEQAEASYAVKGNLWIGYEDVKSATAKAEFIKKSGIGGAMIWNLEYDDFRGICGEKYPILRSLNAALRNGGAWGIGKCRQDRKIPVPDSPNRNTCAAQ